VTDEFMLSGHQQDLPRFGLGQVVEQELGLKFVEKSYIFYVQGIVVPT